MSGRDTPGWPRPPSRAAPTWSSSASRSRSARRRACDPACGRTGARAGHAHAGVPRVPGGDVRERVDVPLVPMTYSSLLEAYGWERFAADARAAGAVDHRRRPARRRALRLRRVQLVAPTSTDERSAPRPRDGRLALPRLAHRHDRRPVGTPPALAGLAARRARSRTESCSTRGSASRRPITLAPPRS